MSVTNWKKTSTNNTIETVMEHLSGASQTELLHPQRMPPESIGGLSEAAELFLDAVYWDKPIGIVGDYDADGITATAILHILSNYLAANVIFRLPHRMSEGYGLSAAIVDEIAPQLVGGLLITVDNGIAAHNAIQKAKEYGLTVIIMDHHLPHGELPKADVIVDQHVETCRNKGHGDSQYEHYCGAGLAYRFAELVLERLEEAEDNELLDKLSVIAALGTIGDVVPLQGDNRCIVREGLAAMREHKANAGLSMLLEACRLTEEETAINLAFRLIPAINAQGRLIDDGASVPCALLTADTVTQEYLDIAQTIVATNEQRKAMVKELEESLVQKLPSKDSGIYVVFDDSVHEGIAGIIANKIVETYGLPAVVMTMSEHGYWKGSGRSIPGVNLKERLDQCSDTMLKYGGHEGAAGLSVAEGGEDAFLAAIDAAFTDVVGLDTDSLPYDIEIDAKDTRDVFEKISTFQPFGEGCPEPSVRINGCKLAINTQYGGKPDVFYMGKNKEHVKLTTTDGFCIIWFFHAEDYRAMGEPTTIDAVGKLSLNISKWGTVLQLLADDVAPSK